MNRALVPAILVAAALLTFASPRADAAYTVSCPFAGTGGDFISRGFYVDYPGKTLGVVTLSHQAPVAGVRTISLTARLSTYDGTFLAIATMTRNIDGVPSKSVFDFGGIPVSAGARITFAQAVVAGDANVYYDTGAETCAGVVETADTVPPLSTLRHDAIGVTITGDPPSIASAALVDCPFDQGNAGDLASRGFYVAEFPGTTIDIVTLRHRTDSPGVKTIQLVAHLATFDGPILGVATASRSVDGAMSNTKFVFDDVPVRAGSTVAFVQTLVAGSGTLFYDTGYGPCDGVVETNATSPPLDAPRRDSAAVLILGRVASDHPIDVVEYYHTGIGHYFMTADPDEIAGLDAGAYGGVFVRTGQSFAVRDGPAPGTVPVCRFFTVAYAPLGSHFYTADADECAGVKLNPNWQYEKIAFWVAAPQARGCYLIGVPVYRAFNNGMTGAPNHRFTTVYSIYDDFVTNRGWAGEGIRFCAVDTGLVVVGSVP